MKNGEFIVFLLFFIIIITILVMQKNNIVYIKSDIDGFTYEVQDTEEKDKVATILATLKNNIKIFTDKIYLDKEKYPEYKTYIEDMYKRIQNVKISETPINSSYTSYTIDKGEEISFCVRSKKTGKLHDINLMMYVTLHELGHVACPEKDHTELFWKIFGFFATRAIEMGLYKKTDFNISSVEYCGLEISDSVV